MEYDDGEIYYDNVEIMEKIEQRKKAKMAAACQSGKVTPEIKKTSANHQQPPVLPPKKKNMVKSHDANKNGLNQRQEDKKIVKVKAPPKPLPTTPTITSPPKPAQVWKHPGLLRTRSIVEEPLAPIVEEDPYQCRENCFRDSVGDVQSQHSSNDSSTSRRKSSPLHSSTDRDEYKFGSLPKSSDSNDSLSGSSTSNTFDVDPKQASTPVDRLKVNAASCHGDQNSLEKVEDENNVKPYGMVDVSWIEKNVGHDSSRTHTNQKQKSVTSRQNPGESASSLNSPLRSKSDASRKPEAESTVFGSGNSEESYDSSKHESFQQNGSSGVCAYMSIPIHVRKTDFGASGRPPSSSPSLPAIPARNLPKATNASNKYKDDEYIYDEIDDYGHKNVFSQNGDAIQRALTDISQVLETIGNEDISHTSSLAFKQFPIPGEKAGVEKVRYDNYFYRGEDARNESSSTQKADGAIQNHPETRQQTTNDISIRSKGTAMTTRQEPPMSNRIDRLKSALPSGQNNTRETGRDDYFESNNSRSLPRSSLRTEMEEMRQDDNDSEERGLSERSESSEQSRGGAAEMSGNPLASVRSLRQSGGESMSSKPDLDDVSEADSFSYSGLHGGGTLPSRRKSTGNAENPKGSTASLGRSNSCERKKSSFRSKFKFRSRSKSQERFGGETDSLGQISSVSDVDEKIKTPRQRGSRLRRRLSRKRMENREAADKKSVQESEAQEPEPEPEPRSSAPISFIRKLLRKSKQAEKEAPQSLRKSQMNSSGSEDTYSLTSSSSKSQHVTSDVTREKQMISPPSRRARKLLHSRQAREKAAISDSSNSDSEAGMKRYNKGESLKRNDEYLEPCEHNNTRVGSQFKERGRKSNSQRAKLSKGRSSKKEQANADKPINTNFHREKYKALVSLNAQTLKKITEKWLTEWRNKLPVGGFLITSWADVVIVSKRPQCVLSGTVIYEACFAKNPGHRLACQIFDRKDVTHRLVRQLENCSTLTTHPNLCSVCSHFHCKVPGALMHPPRDHSHVEALTVVLANVPATSLATYVNRLREVKEQKHVHKQILVMLLQLLQALDNLLRSGFSVTSVHVDQFIVTQEMSLLQILPHAEGINDRTVDDVHGDSGCSATLVGQISDLLSWMLRTSLGSRYQDLPIPPGSDHSFLYLSALKRIASVLRSPPQNFALSTLQNLVQCALWGPQSLVDEDITHQNAFDALALWIDVKQAELVNNIAVLFSTKRDILPIYMFYKHQYFSSIDPEILFHSLRLLGRI